MYIQTPSGDPVLRMQSIQTEPLSGWPPAQPAGWVGLVRVVLCAWMLHSPASWGLSLNSPTRSSNRWFAGCCAGGRPGSTQHPPQCCKPIPKAPDGFDIRTPSPVVPGTQTTRFPAAVPRIIDDRPAAVFLNDNFLPDGIPCGVPAFSHRSSSLAGRRGPGSV